MKINFKNYSFWLNLYWVAVTLFYIIWRARVFLNRISLP